MKGRADEVGEVRGVADDADDCLGADVGDRGLDGVVGRGEGAVAGGRGGLVDVDGVGCRGRIEPEVVGTARLAVAVAIERRARGVDDRRDGRARGGEGQLELVGAVAAAAVAAVAHVGIKGGVAGARDGEKIGAGRHVEADERIAAVIVVVASDHRADCLAVDDVFAIERDDAVELTGEHLTRTGDDRLGGQLAGIGDRERVEVHVGAVGRKILDELLGVVVAGEDGLARQPAAHDGWQVIGVFQAEVVADFVHRNQEPTAAVFAGAPVDPGIHDRGGTRDPGDGRREGGFIGPHVARGDCHAERLSLLKPDAGVTAEDLEDLTGPLLLLGSDGVLEIVAGRILAVNVLKVVLLELNGDAVCGADRSITVIRIGIDIHELPVPRLIHGTRLPGVLKVARRRGDEPASSIDHGFHRRAAGRERPKTCRSSEARVVFDKVGALDLRGRGGNGGRGVADLQPVLLVIGDLPRGERQHCIAGGGVIIDRRRINHGHGLVGTGGRIDFEKLIGGRFLRRDGAQRIFGIEIDNDFVAQLREKKPVGNRNRTHRRHRTTTSEFHDGRKVCTLHRDDSTRWVGTGEFGTE